MGEDEGKQLMFFQGLMQRQGSISTHAYSSLPGFPPQAHMPMLPGACPPPPPLGPGAFTCAGPGYAYAQANAFAYPPPPLPPPLAGPYAYPPQGYPHPGLPSLPYQGHGISCHGGGRQMEGIMESKPKAAGGTAATASATAGYGEISHGTGGDHGGRRQVEVMETTPPKKAGGGTAAATTASASIYGALDKLSRGHGGRSGPFGFFGNCCGGHRTTSFQHADDNYYGHQGTFKGGHHPSKVEHVHGKFHSKSTTWKY